MNCQFPVPNKTLYPQFCGYDILAGRESVVQHLSVGDNDIEPIVVYMVDRHPLEPQDEINPFRWLHPDNGFIKELNDIIGPFDPDELSILMDERPAGEAWMVLLDALVNGKVEMVVTHLAPLTSGQRQQLIGVCAYTGARLITPGDGGRNAIRVLSRF